MSEILIKGGRVIDPATKMDEIKDVLIKDDKVLKIDKDINKDEISLDCQVIDAKGSFVMPGFIDLHVHLRDPGFTYKETITTGANAAARGGVTTICPMPNTKPSTDNPQIVKEIVDRAKSEACVNVLPVGAVTIGQIGKEVTDIKGMVESGICAISEDGKSVMDSNVYREAMKIAKECGIPVMAHCEDINLVAGGVMNLDDNAKKLGLKGISNAVEDIITARDILLAKETGVTLHLCHCSTKDSVRMIKEAKEDGLPVTGEVCPHHFILSTKDIPCDDANYKMNPPLRSEEDVIALKEGLRDGIMDVISTDHAPHSEEEKSRGFEKAPFGIVGLETSASLTYTELVLGGYLTPMQMAEKMSYNPAKVLGIDKGTIKEGSIADVVIFNPEIEYVINPNDFVSMGKNTPFTGKKVTGKVVCTICGGKVVYKD
ncbi:MAG: dihydroorotase [Lachnospiraceae bacterium]|nr:dihydroorotase [Lachnospiraceae bacterium]